MDTTFITIHDLSEQATILYCSDSIVDILGWTPDEVVHRDAWDFFDQHEVPLAKEKHSRGIRLDKAAVLVYVRIKNREGHFVTCECCFSVVYNCMVCCTSVYGGGMSSQKRAVEAPVVRRMFASSPKDPRYHMLSHLSSKFSLGDGGQTHEPRAALFLNRFTRTLTIMYATSGIEEIIGISSESMKGRSFYYCIQERCLEGAVRCLESAKGNDSIAYLRFYYRDPRAEDDSDSATSDSEDGDTAETTASEIESEGGAEPGDLTSSGGESSANSRPSNDTSANRVPSNPRTDSSNSTSTLEPLDVIHAERATAQSSSSSSSVPGASPRSESAREEAIELEAVISCTSDGLVVCLRRARPMVPTLGQTPQPAGIFAAPWAAQPVFNPVLPELPPYPLGAQHPAMAQPVPPPAFQSTFMQSIRDVAVFAWALTGINGSLAEYAHGKPGAESQPPDGFPIWAPEANNKRQRLSADPSGYGSGNSSSSNDQDGDQGLN